MRTVKLFSAAESNQRLDTMLTNLMKEGWTLVHVFDQDKALLIKDLQLEELLTEQEQEIKPKRGRKGSK